VTPRGFLDEDDPRSTRSQAAWDVANVRAIRETPRAVLCVIRGLNVWVPQSVIHVDSEVYADGHEGKLVVYEWWAKAKGLSR
jgi:hypothetical protein